MAVNLPDGRRLRPLAGLAPATPPAGTDEFGSVEAEGTDALDAFGGPRRLRTAKFRASVHAGVERRGKGHGLPRRVHRVLDEQTDMKGLTI